MFEKFYEVVKRIPKGRVASYGTVAKIAGYPRNSRQVGWALHQNPAPKEIPCHRVLFSDGRLSPAFAFGGASMQEKMLIDEGVEVTGGKVDMKAYGIYEF